VTGPLHDLEKRAVILEPPAGRMAEQDFPEELAKPVDKVRYTDLPDSAFERPCVVAALIWYRQTPERLTRCVRSLTGRVGGVVAVDGPYAGLSDQAMSPLDNYHAIAGAVGIPWRIYEGQLWGSEPQKRTAAAHVALELARDIDPEAFPWVLVIDSDEWLMSDLSPEVIEAYGMGSCILRAHRGNEAAPGAEGDGAKMVRLIPNSETLMWGPAHYDVRDSRQTYTGWEKALNNEQVPAFEMGHDIGEKVIAAEYDAYNDTRRLEAEGKMMRVVTDYTKGDEIVVRMDNEQIAAGKWAVDVVVNFAGPLIGQEEAGYARVVEILPVTEDISDIHLERLENEAAHKLIRANAEVAIEQRILQQQLLAKRMQKRARKAERQAKRYGR
jgi:hypothetical protein